MHSKLLHHISLQLSVDENLQTKLEAIFEPIQVAKNSIIEGEGKIPQHLYFINEGYMRSFY